MRMLTVLLMSLIFLFSSCATVIQGTSQEVGVSSSPTGSIVKLNGLVKGETPLNLDIKRKSGGIIKIEKEGYQPAEIIINKKMSGWLLGNILLGGIPGLIVDLVSGGAWALTPESINVTLQPLRTGTGMIDDSTQKIYLTWFELENIKEIEVSTSEASIPESISLNIIN